MATEELRAGLPESERAAFRERLTRDLRWVDDLLAREGLREEDLSAPSRRAVEVLRRIATIPISELPRLPEGSAPARRMHLEGAQSFLDSLLGHLERGDAAPDAIARVRLRAQQATCAAEASCRAAGLGPEALIPRSRSAYAMLRWLSEGDNVERYREAVALAVRVLSRCRVAAGAPVPAPTHVRIEPGRHIWAVRRSGGSYRWRLSPGFLVADEVDLAALSDVALLRRRAPEASRTRYQALLDSEDFLASVAEIERTVAPLGSRARGLAYDLDALFDRLDSTYFHGSLPRPRMEWVPTLSRRRFGYYVPRHDLVCMNPLLDDPGVPASVVECVLYHELLHKKHGSRWADGRRHSHTPEFRAEERRHPHFEETERVLQALAEGPTPSEAPPDREPLAGGAETSEVDLLPLAPAGVPLPSPRPGRNEPCPCGSGRKYKRCHLGAEMP